jgi:AAA ATPase domain
MGYAISDVISFRDAPSSAGGYADHGMRSGPRIARSGVMPLASLAESGVSRVGEVVGRHAELDRLYRLIDGVLEQGGALLVTGDPGIGKSTLLRAAPITPAPPASSFSGRPVWNRKPRFRMQGCMSFSVPRWTASTLCHQRNAMRLPRRLC